MTRPENTDCRITVFAGGDQHWFRNVSIPLIESLEHEIMDDDSITFKYDLPDYLQVDSRPKADAAVLIGGVVGIFAFFASWLATKVLDDVYEVKIQPAIRKALGAADTKLSGANATKPKMLQLGVSYADKNVFILIGIVDDTFDEILRAEHMVKSVHKSAVEWINKNDACQPIHLYIIDRGNVNLEPMQFDNLQLTHKHIQKLDFRASG